MRIWCLVVVLVLVGCGSVKGDDKPIDAPVQIDSPTSGCTDMTSINSCGPSCAMCSATGDREDATCNGTTCGIACKDNAPRCSDNSCSRVVFDFNSGTLEGATPRAPNGLMLAVRTFMGSPALAIDVTSLQEVSFRVPVCLSGTAPFSTRTLSAKVYFAGPPAGVDGYYVQASVPQPVSGAFVGQRALDAGVYIVYTAPLSMSNMSGMTTDVTFQAGTYGGSFAGTIWFDDITIQ